MNLIFRKNNDFISLKYILYTCGCYVIISFVLISMNMETGEEAWLSTFYFGQYFIRIVAKQYSHSQIRSPCKFIRSRIFCFVQYDTYIWLSWWFLFTDGVFTRWFIGRSFEKQIWPPLQAAVLLSIRILFWFLNTSKIFFDLCTSNT